MANGYDAASAHVHQQRCNNQKQQPASLVVCRFPDEERWVMKKDIYTFSISMRWKRRTWIASSTCNHSNQIK